jgi:hypothetical protein
MSAELKSDDETSRLVEAVHLTPDVAGPATPSCARWSSGRASASSTSG